MLDMLMTAAYYCVWHNLGVSLRAREHPYAKMA